MNEEQRERLIVKLKRELGTTILTLSLTMQ